MGSQSSITEVQKGQQPKKWEWLKQETTKFSLANDKSRRLYTSLKELFIKDPTLKYTYPELEEILRQEIHQSDCDSRYSVVDDEKLNCSLAGWYGEQVDMEFYSEQLIRIKEIFTSACKANPGLYGQLDKMAETLKTPEIPWKYFQWITHTDYMGWKLTELNMYSENVEQNLKKMKDLSN